MRHGRSCLTYGKMFFYDISQSGAGLFAFVALLLLALPVVFTFHVLLALPRFADRRRTFWVQPTPLMCSTYAPCGFRRVTSLSRHPLIRFLRPTIMLIQ